MKNYNFFRKVSRNHSTYKIIILDEWCRLNPYKIYPTLEERRELSHKSNLTLAQVTNWFKNKRKGIFTKMAKISIENKYIFIKYFDNENQNPCSDERRILALKTGLSEKRICAWFAKQRFKVKKQYKI